MDDTHWFSKAIIYHILIDRFANFSSKKHWKQPLFLGGTIKGIIEKLPYLKKFGINTIWISPFYKTSAYHGYHITDFFSVDPHFGTETDLKNLINTVHKHKMRIIADFVPNHCSNKHPFFLDAQNSKQSPYRDWFYFLEWPNEYLCFLSVNELPKINLDYHDAREHIIRAAKYWLTYGLDGYRLDHVIGPSHRFWKAFRKELKTTFPSVVLIGEAWMMGIKRTELKTLGVNHRLIKWLFGAAPDGLLKEYVGELDGVLDFRFQELVKTFIADSQLNESSFHKNLEKHYRRFPDNYYLPTFLDNHDIDRFLFLCRNDKDKLKKAAHIQFSLPQPVIIYYGTEKAMTQKKSIWSVPTYGDILARQPMNWNCQDTSLFSFYQSLIQQRKERRQSF
jgi:glycosidase